MKNKRFYLPAGMPAPVPEADGLDAPYWQGTRAGKLMIQRCRQCERWQWGPEWICHRCHAFDLGWEAVAPHGRIYSWERTWHAPMAALKDGVPYLSVLVELVHADGIRMVGNLLGDPLQEVKIGAEVRAVFEPHDEAPSPYTLVQWEYK
ncbi:DNA-binding protein [Bordetella petrii]|nr:DNA-binding protein [Bordetella petrii]